MNINNSKCTQLARKLHRIITLRVMHNELDLINTSVIRFTYDHCAKQMINYH